MTGSALAQLHRDLIINLAARHKLPGVYFDRTFIAAGGLISYGPDLVDQFRLAASYVNRLLRGEKPADLAGAGADKVPAADQPQDCQGAGPHRAAVGARSR